jgi:hypothetical protein
MRVRHALVIASLLVPPSIAMAAAEDQQPLLFQQKAAKTPYAKLFGEATAAVEPPQQRPDADARGAERREQPKVVCGMVIIPADADVDPRFRLSVPRNDNVKSTIRAIKPPMCHPED